jgi:hypothetical protein
MQTPDPRLERAATAILNSLRKKRELNRPDRMEPVPPGNILAALLKLSPPLEISAEELRQIITNLQTAGHPIAWDSEKKGYLYAMTWSEMEKTAELLKARAMPAVAQYLGAVKVFRDLPADVPEQIMFFVKETEPEGENPAFS